MPTLKYKDGDGNYQSLVGLNVQNQVVQTTGQSTTAVMSQKAVSDLVPAQASASNQLADKDFVNSSITTATATYRGSYNLVSDLSLTISASHGQIETALNTAATGADNNDYCFVQIPTADATPTEIASVERYKHNSTTWSYEYAINNSGFTAAQWAAVNSGITSGLVAKLGQLTSNPQNSIAALFGMDASGNFQNITTANLASVLSADTSGNNFLCKTTLYNDYVKISGYGLELGATRNSNGGLIFTYSKNDNTTEQFSWKGWTDDQNAYTVPPGCTYFGERGQNIPSNYCIVLTLVKGQNGAQIAIDQDGYLWSRKGTTWRKCATV